MTDNCTIDAATLAPATGVSNDPNGAVLVVVLANNANVTRDRHGCV